MKHVLFIHPDQKLFQLYQPHLSQHFFLDSAQDGLRGLRKIKTNKPHLVVSDYQLPWLSGLSLLKFVRQNRRLAGMPFIFLTDHPSAHDALSFGANDWIVKKTAHPDMLIEKIYHHLKQNHYHYGI